MSPDAEWLARLAALLAVARPKDTPEKLVSFAADICAAAERAAAERRKAEGARAWNGEFQQVAQSLRLADKQLLALVREALPELSQAAPEAIRAREFRHEEIQALHAAREARERHANERKAGWKRKKRAAHKKGS